MYKVVLLLLLLIPVVSCQVVLDPPGGCLQIVPEVSRGSFSGKIELSWKAVSGADGYYVYVSPVENGSYSRVTSEPVTTREYSYTAVAPYFHWYFKISALIKGEESALSYPADGWVCPGGMDSVWNQENDTLVISWDGIPGAEKYALQTSLSQYGPFYLVTGFVSASTDGDGYIQPGAVGERVEVTVWKDLQLDRWYRVLAAAQEGSFLLWSFPGSLIKDAK